MSNGNTLKYRVDNLERSFDKLDGKVDAILTNHLPHIQEALVKMKTRIDMGVAINAVQIIVVIAGIILLIR